MMKRTIIPAFLVGCCSIVSCDSPKPSGFNQVVEALEEKTKAAEDRAAEAERKFEEARVQQSELQRQLEEQQLAMERDALERERELIEQRREEMARLQDEQNAAAEAELRQRETTLQERELALEGQSLSLNSRQETLEQQAKELDQRDQELAGREAIGNMDTDPGPDFNVNTVDVFYDSLSPYGSWFDSPDYGFVWRPAVARTVGWSPYTRGRWSCTNRGWMWLSDEPFGWATYHYGRWARCRSNGWLWVPGTEWAPSWVCWRSGSSHIGWAPLPPETLAYPGRIWDSSVELTFGIGSAWFSFVETSNFCRPIYSHCIPVSHYPGFWGNTTNITYIHTRNNRVICGGPRYGDVQRQTRTRPSYYRIEESRNPQRGSSQVNYQPYVRDGRVAVSKPRREESRNPGAVINRPTKVSGRLDRIDVDRQTPVDAKIRDDFRRERKLDARDADVAAQQNKSSSTRGEEQRRLVEHAQTLEKDLRQTDDRVRVMPKRFDPDPSGKANDIPGGVERERAEEPRDRQTVNPPTRPDNRYQVLPRKDEPTVVPSSPAKVPGTDRGEEQRRLVELAENREKEMRETDDRVRVMPKRADPNSTDGSSGASTEPKVLPRSPGSQPTAPTRNEQSREAESRRQAEAAQAQRQQLEAAQRQRAEQQRNQQQETVRQRQQSIQGNQESQSRSQQAAEQNARLQQQQRAAAEQSARMQHQQQQQRTAQPNTRMQQPSAPQQGTRIQPQTQWQNPPLRTEQPRDDTRKNR